VEIFSQDKDTLVIQKKTLLVFKTTRRPHPYFIRQIDKKNPIVKKKIKTQIPPSLPLSLAIYISIFSTACCTKNPHFDIKTTTLCHGFSRKETH
jgi:hypothetical protein